MTFSVVAFTDISHIDSQVWDKAFHQTGGPCLKHYFLLCLEQSNSVGENTGWSPYHLGIKCENELIALLPGYIKTHSYGEYIFDHAWANAYAQHGINYYPKWINAIPFTPVTAQRIGWIEDVAQWQVLPQIIECIKTYLYDQHFSSVHFLFANHQEHQQLTQTPLLHRLSLQFEWRNQTYTDFDDFLGHCTSRKRRSIRKERKKIEQQQITIERLHGSKITPEHMRFFYDCYRATYLKRSGHEGYLTHSFFEQLFAHFAKHMLLVLAKENDQYIAGSLFLFDANQLYGRYWGALSEVDGLHFECCYYQGIEFAIEHNIQRFNPGTQGEHKILRGFAPTYCHSFHALAHSDFETAVDDFLQREKIGMKQYKMKCDELLPFKQNSDS
ncbi:MAG: GNAT family N-acetyltransferase [Glaciecola sp.]